MLITESERALLYEIKWKIEKEAKVKKKGLELCVNFYTNVYPYQLSCKMNRVNVI